MRLTRGRDIDAACGQLAAGSTADGGRGEARADGSQGQARSGRVGVTAKRGVPGASMPRDHAQP